LASLRKAEELIAQGKVSVNGSVVSTQGVKVDPEADDIRVEGMPLRPAAGPLYVALHKPVGYVTTMDDPEGRPTVADLVGRIKARLFPVGRLDYGSSGLLLLTNDGELAQHLMRPEYGVERRYLVKLKGKPDVSVYEAWQKGGRAEGMRYRPIQTRPVRKPRSQKHTWVEMRLREGKNREIRRLADAAGHPALKIIRTSYATVTLGDLAPGEYRVLEPEEVKALKGSVEPASKRARQKWAIAKPQRTQGVKARPRRRSDAKPTEQGARMGRGAGRSRRSGSSK